MASIAGVAAGQGLDIPLLGQNPAFDPALMETPAAKALVANATIAGPVAPFASEEPAVKAVSDAYTEAYGTKDAKATAQVGYAESEVMYQILNKACENKDLTRPGIIKAMHELSGIDTGGIVAGALDYTKVGEPSTR